MKNRKKSVAQQRPKQDLDQVGFERQSAGDGQAPSLPKSQVDDDSLWGPEPDTGEPHDPVLFTNSALRLHLPDKLPPTPGRRPSLRRRLLERARKLLNRL